MEEIKDSQPNFWAVLPAIVRYDKKLSSTQKILFAEISALTNKDGYCWASNSYFADLFGISDTQVSTSISKLKKEGYITSDVENNYKRKIFLTEKVIGGIKKTYKGYKENLKGVLSKVKYNNISNNINNITSVETKVSPEINNLIKLFEPINPSYKELFGNNTQRKALERLLKEHGLEKVESMIRSLPKVILKPYAPRVTTPLKLEQKLGELVVFVSQERSKNGGNKFAKME